MPAFIAHMLIANAVCKRLGEAAKAGNQEEPLTMFTRNVLDKHSAYMRLGALGPDMPYYGSVRSAVDGLLHRHNKPTGVDQWSYQLHSKHPNLFPLKMAEIIWKESNPTTGPEDPWEEEDEQKFAFLCGFLTHMAADQVIHPLVNYLAGPYTKTGDARKLHAECEVHQDLYLLYKHFGNQLTARQFENAQLQTWSDLNPGAAWQRQYPLGLLLSLILSPIEAGLEILTWPFDLHFDFMGRAVLVPFRYMIQKSFVEAHAVTPRHRKIQSWVKGLWLIQRNCPTLKPYTAAHKNLFTQSGELNTNAKEFQTYIACAGLERCYDDYVRDAEKLSSIYIQALLKLHEEKINDAARRNFLKVVQNADLAAPLEKVTAARAKKALDEWDNERVCRQQE
jgi:hypothetical protein